MPAKSQSSGPRRPAPRVVHAATPTLPPSSMPPSNFVVSVALKPGERVEWTWTHEASGASYASGYTIVRPQRKNKPRAR